MHPLFIFAAAFSCSFLPSWMIVVLVKCISWVCISKGGGVLVLLSQSGTYLLILVKVTHLMLASCKCCSWLTYWLNGWLMWSICLPVKCREREKWTMRQDRSLTILYCKIKCSLILKSNCLGHLSPHQANFVCMCHIFYTLIFLFLFSLFTQWFVTWSLFLVTLCHPRNPC